MPMGSLISALRSLVMYAELCLSSSLNLFLIIVLVRPGIILAIKSKFI